MNMRMMPDLQKMINETQDQRALKISTGHKTWKDRLVVVSASLASPAIILGLLYAALFAKPHAVIPSVPIPAIDMRDRFYGLAQPKEGVLWAVGGGGKIVRSEDAGRTWSAQRSPAAVPLQSIAAWDGNRAVTVGNRGVVLVTQDGGKNWIEVKAPTSSVANKLMRIRALPDGRAWAVGEMAALLRSDNYGMTWVRVRPEEDVGFSDIYFLGLRGWIVGEFGRLMRTVDGGATWQTASVPFRTSLTSVAFRDEMNGVAVGLSGSILTTRDGGVTWSEATSGTREHLFAMAWDGSTWYAVGDKGVILKGDATAANWSPVTLPEHTMAWFVDMIKTGDRIYLAGARLVTLENGRLNYLGQKLN